MSFAHTNRDGETDKQRRERESERGTDGVIIWIAAECLSKLQCVQMCL